MPTGPRRSNMTHSNYTVTGTSGEALAANGQRDFLMIQNIGANECYITVDGSAAVTGEDIYLAANGNGIIAFDYVVPTAQINAISASGTTLVIIAHNGES